MSQCRRSIFALFALALLCGAFAAAAAPAADAYGRIPLTFEANRGQADSAVRFLTRGQRYTMFLTPAETVLTLKGGEQKRAVVRWQMTGANRDVRITGENPVAATSNYLHGNDPRNWQTGVANYGQVRYEEIYPGIDVVYRGNQRQVEYDFVIAPRANPNRIRMAFQGAESISIGTNGELIIHTAAGDLVQPRPDVYQDIDGQRQRIDGRYALLSKNRVGFVLGHYDRNKALVIDPVLAWSTYLGGSLVDEGLAIAVDGSGNTYITGLIESLDYPTVNAIQSTNGFDYDACVTKINAAGTAIVYSTYLGGNGGNEYGLGIAVDSSGNAFVTGGTNSTNFPGVTGSSIQSSFGGSYRDGFLTKINAAGSAIVYSTYLGGSGDDLGWSVTTDSSGNAYVVGGTGSSDFPITVNALQLTYNNGDGFLTKVDPSGGAIYSTFIGGSGGDGLWGVKVDSSNNVYLAGGTGSTDLPGIDGSSLQSTNGGGGDAFIMKLNSSGTAITYATYLGDSGSDTPTAIALDSSNNIYVAGNTDGTSFPGVTGSSIQSSNAGSNEGFVTKINAAGSAIVYSTFIGGSDYDQISVNGLAVDSSGNAVIVGATASTTMTGVTAGSMQPASGGGADAFITKINAAGTAVVYSTFLGGSGDDIGDGIAMDSSGDIYLTGWTSSPFPGASGSAIQPTYGGGTDGFVAKLANSASPSVSSISPSSGVPGTQVTLTGTGFGAVQGTGSVWLGNKLAGSIVSWSDTQVVATVDSNVASGSASVQQAGTWSNSLTFTIITPTISSISPTSGVPGTQVTINGTNFGSTQGSGQVWLGSTYAGSIVSWSATQIVATVAANSVSGNAQVQQSGVWGNQIAFTVTSPSITSVSPSTARAGDSITINGTNFGSTQGTGKVWLGSKLAGSITSWSSTQIVATVASGSISGTVQVQQNSVWGNSLSFTVITPVISSVSPTTARAGDSITISGTGFGSTQGSGQVWLGSKLAGSITSWSDTQIVATVASGSVTGTAQVQQGGVWNNYGTFTVITPVLSSISPTSGPVGTQVTFTGTGFGTTQGSGKVWLANKYATIVSWSDTQVVATVIAGSSTSASQVLQGGVWSNTITFTVTP